MGMVLNEDTQREKRLKQRIAEIKKQEKKLREERHHLESELRKMVYDRFIQLEKNIESKIKEL